LSAGLSSSQSIGADRTEGAGTIDRSGAGIAVLSNFERTQRIASILGDTVNRSPETGRAMGAGLSAGKSVSSSWAKCAGTILWCGAGITVLSQTSTSQRVTSIRRYAVNWCPEATWAVSAGLSSSQSIGADRAEGTSAALRSGTGITVLSNMESTQWVASILGDAVNRCPEAGRAMGAGLSSSKSICTGWAKSTGSILGCGSGVTMLSNVESTQRIASILGDAVDWCPETRRALSA